MTLKDYNKVESSIIEFKEKVEYKKYKNWLKTISAFANTSGGFLLFGVRDIDKKIIGLNNIEKDSEKISELINNKIIPVPNYRLLTIDENDKVCLIIKIEAGNQTPYYYDSDGRKEAFVRVGNQSLTAPKHILDDLILKGKNTNFDELSSRYGMTDVSFTLLNATLKKETGKEINDNKDYLSLELISKDNKVTNAGLLLCDQGLLTQSRIFCTRWKGITKGTLEVDAVDDKEYTGSIISLLYNAETFIKNNSKVSWKIEGMKRIEKEDYPVTAVREAIVNAIIHRDYHIIGSEIHIDMYDNRLEITSPGGMMNCSFVQDLDITKISSIRRNRIISDVFSRLHFMERRGSGLTRILESYNGYNIKPTFISDFSTFKVIFPNKNYFKQNKDENNNKILEGNVVSDEDYFLINMYKKAPDTLSKKTFEKIQKLFNKFTYKYEFKREDVEKIFNLKKTRALDIINLLLDCNLIKSLDSNKYIFKK